MAEMVQSIMDGMVPALRELMDDGIFSEVCHLEEMCQQELTNYNMIKLKA